MVAYRIEIYDPEGRRGEEWIVRDRYTCKEEAEAAYAELMSRMSLGKARLTKVYEKIVVLESGPDYTKARKFRVNKITGMREYYED